MKTTLKFIFFFILLFESVAGFAQSEPAPLRANLDFEKLEWANPWLNSANASGLTMFSRSLPEFQSLSNATLSHSRASGDFRCPVTPPRFNNTGLETRSVLRLDRTFLGGYFNYDLTNRVDAQWNGLFVPGSNPFFMADSIPGRFRSETFSAGVRIAHPIGRNHAIGLGMDYIAGRGAKGRDLRNENRYTDFTIRPAWLMNLDRWTIGAALGWSRIFENISYREVAVDAGAKWLFFMWGNWFFEAEPFHAQTTLNSRIRTDITYSAHIQLQYAGRRFSIYNEFGLALKEGIQYLSLSSNRQFGDVESTTFQNNLVIHAFENHRLLVDFHYRHQMGFRPVQILERDPHTLANVWRTLDRNLVFEAIESTQNIMYSFLSRRDDGLNIHWQLDAGASLFQREQIYHHGMEFVQRVSNMEFFAGFNKNFRFGRASSIDIRPLVAFRTGSGEKNDAPPPGTGNARQLTAQMEREFYTLTCDRLRLQLAVRYSHLIRNRDSRVFAFATYDFLKPLGTNPIFENQTRDFISVGLGIVF